MSLFTQSKKLRFGKKLAGLAKEIYSISDRGSFARDFGLRDQIREASVSIAPNIAEGFERDGNAEFIHFLSLAKGSAGEVQTQLQIATDVGHVHDSDCHRLTGDVILIGKMLGRLMNYLHKSQSRGKKFYPPRPHPERGTRNSERS